MGNHSMGVVTDGESYEKILIFGGISNTIGDTIDEMKSALSNRAFLLSLNAKAQGKGLFKD